MTNHKQRTRPRTSLFSQTSCGKNTLYATLPGQECGYRVSLTCPFFFAVASMPPNEAQRCWAALCKDAAGPNANRLKPRIAYLSKNFARVGATGARRPTEVSRQSTCLSPLVMALLHSSSPQPGMRPPGHGEFQLAIPAALVMLDIPDMRRHMLQNSCWVSWSLPVLPCMSHAKNRLQM